MTSKQVTSPPWNSRRLAHSKELVWASRWSVALRAFYRQILSLLYVVLFFFWKFRPRLARELLVYVCEMLLYHFDQWTLVISIFSPSPPVGRGWGASRARQLLHDGEAEALHMFRLYKVTQFLQITRFRKVGCRNPTKLQVCRPWQPACKKQCKYDVFMPVLQNAGFGTIPCREGIENKE